MSIILSQDAFECDSTGWRPKGPKDHWSITVQVVQRYDKPADKPVPRKPEISLDIKHTADDTDHKEWTNTPLTPYAARRLAKSLADAADLAEKVVAA